MNKYVYVIRATPSPQIISCHSHQPLVKKRSHDPLILPVIIHSHHHLYDAISVKVSIHFSESGGDELFPNVRMTPVQWLHMGNETQWVTFSGKLHDKGSVLRII